MEEKMQIIQYDEYLDGGTVEIRTDKDEIYCFDNRIKTKTPNELYLGYPKDDNSNLILDSKVLKDKIFKALKNYKHKFFKPSIDNFIKTKK